MWKRLSAQIWNRNSRKYENVDVSVCLCPIVSTLRLLGCCPLSLTKSKKYYFDCSYVHVKYAFQFFSLPTFYTAVIISLYFLLSALTIVRDVVVEGRYEGLVQNAESYGWVLDCFVSVYYLWLVLNPILISIRCRGLAEFLEKITDFTVQFQISFPREKLDFSTAKRKLILTRISTGILGIIFNSVMVYMYMPCILQLEGDTVTPCETEDERNRAIWAVIGVVLGYTIGFYQDTLMISLLHILHNMLLEVERGMQNHCNRNLVEHIGISNWVTVGRSIKTQADLFNRIVGPWELGTLLCNFLTWILLAFMTLNSSMYESIVVNTCLFYCWSNLARLHGKTIVVQRIRTVEKRIRNLTVGLKTNDPIVEAERSLLVSAMTCKPIQFNLCNLITFDSSLTAWLIGGVVSYLMVLLQFQNLETID